MFKIMQKRQSLRFLLPLSLSRYCCRRWAERRAFLPRNPAPGRAIPPLSRTRCHNWMAVTCAPPSSK